MKSVFSWVAIIAVISTVSCKKNDTTPTPPRTDIHLDQNSTLGYHIVDKDGRTLYYFSDDVNGQSSCAGGCLTTWPIFYADSGTTTFSADLSSADFKTILTSGGVKQTTYKGWPLYYYAPGGTAEVSGAEQGEGIGNIWFVAKPNYSITIANYQLTGGNGVNYLADYSPGDGRTNYFCDANGNTLYSFGKDSALMNKYTKPDLSNNDAWPVYETENITVPSTLDKSLFAVISTYGKKQLTYKGWPIYYFGPDDHIRGNNKGITIPPTLVGKIWPVATKDAVPAP